MRKALVLLAILAVGVATVANADTKIIDYQGFAWETGGFLPSNVSDELQIVAEVNDIDPVFNVDLQSEEVTVYMNNLISTGQVPFGGGFYSISYDDGVISLYEDPAMNAAYGVNPPNATSPSTFVDGDLLLQGNITSFVAFWDDNTGTGSYEGTIEWTGGSALATVQGIENDGYTFGGLLNPEGSSGNVPEGYHLQVDGVIEVEVTVSVEEKTWSEIKGLYNGR